MDSPSCLDPCVAAGTCVDGTFSCFDKVAWKDGFECDDGASSCAVNPDRWTAVVGHPIIGAQVQQIFRPANAVAENGILAILAEYDPQDGNLYSAMVRTGQTSLNPTGTAGFGWGRVDFRAWIPRGQYATWPALWLADPSVNGLGNGNATWPPEFDVMEDFGSNPFLYGHYFSCNSGGLDCPNDYSVVGAKYSPTEGWHTYSVTRRPAGSFGTSTPPMMCLWVDGELAFDVDYGYPACVWEGLPLGNGVVVHVLDTQTDPPGVPMFQLLMNITIGGQILAAGKGEFADASYQPQTMYIDSVTVYQPSRCPANCTDDSPVGYHGYSCSCADAPARGVK